MHAFTGHWSTARVLEVERQRLARERASAARNRAAHRKLDRWTRLVRDLEAVDKKLRAAVKVRKADWSAAQARTVVNLLRRRNRLVDALNKFTGASQAVKPEAV